MTTLSWLPSVHACLEDPPPGVEDAGSTLARAALEAALGDVREELLEDPGRYAGSGEVVREVRRRWTIRLEALRRSGLPRVVNATGVVVHTNLGRAPLAGEAAEAAAAAAGAYVPLEYDLARGVRGSRYDHAVDMLRRATGAEDALVVNNNAAALLLVANGLAAGREVVLSRGELIEIGGGFRIHEILTRSGARLVEVGATNKTHPADYERALERGDVGAVLKVHRSNFAVSGFVAEVGLEEACEIGARYGVPVVFDQGTGILESIEAAPGEPTVRGALEAGADVVIASGDKLLGGPQAGLVWGRTDVIAGLRANPLLRALRVDKTTLAALEATLRIALSDPAGIPVRRMIARPTDELRRRAETMRDALSDARLAGARVEPHAGRAGGGTLPGLDLAGWALVIDRGSASEIAARLRACDPPIVARVADGSVWIDPRAMSRDDERIVTDRLIEILRQRGDEA